MRLAGWLKSSFSDWFKEFVKFVQVDPLCDKLSALPTVTFILGGKRVQMDWHDIHEEVRHFQVVK